MLAYVACCFMPPASYPLFFIPSPPSTAPNPRMAYILMIFAIKKRQLVAHSVQLVAYMYVLFDRQHSKSVLDYSFNPLRQLYNTL